MPNENEVHVKVSLEDIYTSVLNIDAKVTSMTSNVDELVTIKMPDHESRLRSLEKNIWKLVSVSAVAGAVLIEIASKIFGV